MRVVLCTAPPERAPELARTLVERRLAACVNLIPGVRSVYRWKDEVQDDAETLMVIKTGEARIADLVAAVPGLHPYEVPEVIALGVLERHAPYAAWVEESTRQA